MTPAASDARGRCSRLDDGRTASPSRAPYAIPSRPASSVSASNARHLAAVAAVAGRDFDFTLIQQAAWLDPEDAARAVEELVARRILHVDGERLDFISVRAVPARAGSSAR